MRCAATPVPMWKGACARAWCRLYPGSRPKRAGNARFPCDWTRSGQETLTGTLGGIFTFCPADGTGEFVTRFTFCRPNPWPRGAAATAAARRGLSGGHADPGAGRTRMDDAAFGRDTHRGMPTLDWYGCA